MSSYTYRYTVNLDDLDFMNHVGHAHWLIILMRARVELLEKSGLPYQVFLQQGIGTVVAEAKLKYLRPAVFGDYLTISMTSQEPFSKGFTLHYEVKNQHDKLCLKADITLVFVNLSGKSIEIPEEFKRAFFEKEMT